MKKNIVEEFEFFDEAPLQRGSEDYDMWLKFAYNKVDFYGIPKPLVTYRIHPEGTSQKTE